MTVNKSVRVSLDSISFIWENIFHTNSLKACEAIEQISPVIITR